MRLSAPVLLALFFVDIGFGMLGKIAQGLNVHDESQPVKALFGLGVFSWLWHTLLAVCRAILLTWWSKSTVRCLHLVKSEISN